jgi:hypothetical protein
LTTILKDVYNKADFLGRLPCQMGALGDEKGDEENLLVFSDFQ